MLGRWSSRSQFAAIFEANLSSAQLPLTQLDNTEPSFYTLK
jgi:hypothetical protein